MWTLNSLIVNWSSMAFATPKGVGSILENTYCILIKKYKYKNKFAKLMYSLNLFHLEVYLAILCC